MANRSKNRRPLHWIFAYAIIAAVTIISAPAFGQQRIHDAANLALGEIPILPTPSSFVLNPALLANTTGRIACATAYRPFGVSEMTHYTIGGSTFGERFGFGAVVASTGDETMSEARGSIGGAGRISSNLSVGVVARITRISVPSVGSATAAAVTVGVLLTPLKPLMFGASVDGASRSVHGDLVWSEPRSTYLAATYRISDALTLHTGAARDAWRGWSHSVALEVFPRPWFILRLGRTGGPDGVTGGLEYRGDRYRIAYGTRLHRELDATHAVTFSINQ